MTADGEWHTVTINVAGTTYWKGTLQQLRFDFFDNCQPGESVLVQSIVLDPIN